MRAISLGGGLRSREPNPGRKGKSSRYSHGLALRGTDEEPLWIATRPTSDPSATSSLPGGSSASRGSWTAIAGIGHPARDLEAGIRLGVEVSNTRLGTMIFAGALVAWGCSAAASPDRAVQAAPRARRFGGTTSGGPAGTTGTSGTRGSGGSNAPGTARRDGSGRYTAPAALQARRRRGRRAGPRRRRGDGGRGGTRPAAAAPPVRHPGTAGGRQGGGPARRGGAAGTGGQAGGSGGTGGGGGSRRERRPRGTVQLGQTQQNIDGFGINNN